MQPNAMAEETSIVKADTDYIKTPNGILRMVTAAFSIIAFICSITITIIPGYSSENNFVHFSTVTGFLVALVFFLINIFLPSIPRYVPNGFVVDITLCAIYTVFLLISGILSADYSWIHPTIAATCAFCFMSGIAFAVSVVLVFKQWKQLGGKLPFKHSTWDSSFSSTAPTPAPAPAPAPDGTGKESEP